MCALGTDPPLPWAGPAAAIREWVATSWQSLCPWVPLTSPRSLAAELYWYHVQLCSGRAQAKEELPSPSLPWGLAC